MAGNRSSELLGMIHPIDAGRQSKTRKVYDALGSQLSRLLSQGSENTAFGLPLDSSSTSVIVSSVFGRIVLAMVADGLF